MIAAFRGPIGRSLLAAAGLVVLAYLVRGAGPERVAHVMWQTRSWMPTILAFEVAQLLGDVVALRSLLRRQSAKVPPSTWVRSSAIAYAMMILLPAGRAAGEVARATLISQHIGVVAAASASAQLQAAYVFAIAVASAAAFGVVASTFGLHAPLALLLAGNAVLMLAIAAGLFEITRGGPLARWFHRTASLLLHPLREREPRPASEPATRRALPWRGAVACSIARAGQLVQYGVVLSSVGGVGGVRGAFIAHGIHLVGATIGDVVPNQLGIADATYGTFAGALGLSNAPARALSIAFVAHIAQLTMAGICVLVAALTRRELTGPAGRETATIRPN
ncbi:MAG: hypothetical protein ABSF69_02525 [Polyangiaceae bacterium]